MFFSCSLVVSSAQDLCRLRILACCMLFDLPRCDGLVCRTPCAHVVYGSFFQETGGWFGGMESTSCSESSAFERRLLAFGGLKDVNLSAPDPWLDVFHLVPVLQFVLVAPPSFTSISSHSAFYRPTLILSYCPDNIEARFVDVGVLTPRRSSANRKNLPLEVPLLSQSTLYRVRHGAARS
ncbi:hypothetical protein C8J57DRAFT_1537341 [Mycena rebaudengoi]|nr:hypothetical protein C8J57DRAFT_1537341 [Mycena rebaudengoi]